jgi:hypothetical protein
MPSLRSPLRRLQFTQTKFHEEVIVRLEVDQFHDALLYDLITYFFTAVNQHRSILNHETLVSYATSIRSLS